MDQKTIDIIFSFIVKEVLNVSPILLRVTIRADFEVIVIGELVKELT